MSTALGPRPVKDAQQHHRTKVVRGTGHTLGQDGHKRVRDGFRPDAGAFRGLENATHRSPNATGGRRFRSPYVHPSRPPALAEGTERRVNATASQERGATAGNAGNPSNALNHRSVARCGTVADEAEHLRDLLRVLAPPMPAVPSASAGFSSQLGALNLSGSERGQELANRQVGKLTDPG